MDYKCVALNKYKSHGMDGTQQNIIREILLILGKLGCGP
jgi:hypothetical protein